MIFWYKKVLFPQKLALVFKTMEREQLNS